MNINIDININMKTIRIIILLLLLQSSTATAANRSIQHDTYEAASEASDYIQFEMKSRKLGLVTTPFTSFVKSATIRYEMTENAFQQIEVVIDAASIDTGNSSRNTKMWEKCLSIQQFPSITIMIPAIAFSDTAHELPGTINVRGVEFPISVHVNSSNASNISGSTLLSVADLGIPDPSISIAKLLDEIKISFNVAI